MSAKVKIAAGVSAAVLAIAVPLLTHFEGTIFKTYRDPVGIKTACVGHTGPELQMGQTFTRAECDELLAADLEEHDKGMRACVRVELSDGEHAAYLSFTFNAGVAAWCTSSMSKLLNTGDRFGACAALSKWVISKGLVLPGLVRRRAAERRLCESGLPLGAPR